MSNTGTPSSISPPNGRLRVRAWAASHCLAVVTAAAILLAAAPAALAQFDGSRRAAIQSLSGRANAGSLGVISGGADGTYIRIAADLANVLDGDDLRILPIIGRGSLQNLRDLMFMRGIDVGIVQMDAREALKADNLQDEALQRLRYIARLYNEEVHVLASRDITDIRQLEGKQVNIDKAGSGTNLTARIIFEKLGVKPEFTTYDQASSYERLRSGEIQAAMYVAGRPVRGISEFQSDGRFHLLSVPFEKAIAETYLPARLSHSDYPKLIDTDRTVDTLAVGSILAVFNWPERSDRYQRIQRFVDAFFSRFNEFSAPGRHPKWKEVSLTAEAPGWQRIKAAQNWIDADVAAETTPASFAEFQRFTDANGILISAADRERLFRNFLAWQRERGRKRARASQ